MRSICVIGSGVIGLSIAFELKNRDFDVTVITRNYEEGASWTSGGMLAPFSEGLNGEMLEFCIESLYMYDEYVNRVESVAGFSIDYRRNGILRIALDEREGERILQYSEIYRGMKAEFEILEGSTLKNVEPLISEKITFGVHYKDEGGVDTEKLMDALLLSAEKLGIRIVLDEIKNIIRDDGNVKEIEGLKQTYKFDFYIVTTGAWNEIVPHLPVFPIKGQLLKIKGISMDRIIFSDNVYIIPKESYILIGATSEDAGFDTRATLGGVNTLSSNALEVVPKLSQSSFHDVLVGFRPATPDEMPIFEYGNNYIVATGHYRNGILLSPITARIVSEYVEKGKESKFFKIFSAERFGKQ